MIRWKAKNGYYVAFGSHGLKAVESGYISSRQLEAARKVMIRHVRKVGKIWFRVFPDVPITKKWLEMPMGSGKGDVDEYRARVKKWKVIFEMTGLSTEEMKEVFDKASKRLPIKTRVVEKWEIH